MPTFNLEVNIEDENIGYFYKMINAIKRKSVSEQQWETSATLRDLERQIQQESDDELEPFNENDVVESNSDKWLGVAGRLLPDEYDITVYSDDEEGYFWVTLEDSDHNVIHYSPKKYDESEKSKLIKEILNFYISVGIDSRWDYEDRMQKRIDEYYDEDNKNEESE